MQTIFKVFVDKACIQPQECYHCFRGKRDMTIRDAVNMVDCQLETEINSTYGYRYYVVTIKGKRHKAYTDHEVIGLLETHASDHPRLEEMLEGLGR